jgi:hypothetical protein
MMDDIRQRKDVIRNTLGKRIKVNGKIHIIVPASVDRPFGMKGNYLNHENFVLPKIE